jgi:AAA domain
MQLIKKPTTAVMKRPQQVIRRPQQSSHALEIKQSSGQASIFKTSWLVIGLPKIGKSTLGSGFEGCLYLVTSEKEVGSLQVDYILIDSWEKLMGYTDELINNRSKYDKYKFLIIDFVDAVWTMCVIAVCDKLGVPHTSDAAYGKGVDTVDTYFKRWVTTIVASDYGIIFVSHVVQKDIITSGQTVTKTICSLPIRGRNILFPLVNVIGCMEYKTVQIPNQKTGKIDLTRKRIISFEGNEYVEAGDRDGVLPREIILSKDPKVNYEIFKDYYEGRRKK